jgi:hypothetical protein
MKTRLINLRNSRQEKAVLIDRRTPFGNPFKMETEADRDKVCDLHEEWFKDKIKKDASFRREVEALRGKTLACWCTPKRCHGDTIIAYLERDSDSVSLAGHGHIVKASEGKPQEYVDLFNKYVKVGDTIIYKDVWVFIS